MNATVRKIQVMYQGWGEHWTLGFLVANNKNTVFEYTPEAIAKGIEFSPRHLPLSNNSFQDFPQHQLQLPGLISDSLPDGWGMMLMDRFFKKYHNREPHQIHTLERLAFLGDRTLGAFTYLPATENLQISRGLNLQELAQATVQIQRDQDTELLAAIAMVGGSPQGARPKSLVYYEPITKQMSTEAFRGAEPWIIKFPAQNELPEVCAIEASYLEMAQRCGFEVPEFRYLPINKNLSALAIKRFDRSGVQGEIRVPTHSLAGALHADFRIPNANYNIFLRMTRFMTKNEDEVYKAFARAVFNVCMNNRDDHTKNSSFVMTKSKNWVLSPAYDLTYNTGLNGHHQMDIEGESLKPTRAHFLSLIKNAGLSLPRATKILNEIVNTTSHAATIFANYPISKKSTEVMLNTIQHNCQLLAD
jgi:serine/threonine-protein kinase HipA